MENDLYSLMPSEDEALRRALTATGFGLLGTRKGQTAAGIGRAGLLGMGVYNQSLENQAAQNAKKLVLAQHIAQQEAAQAQAQQESQAFAALAGMGSGVPGPSIAGPEQAFQQPGGAAALMNVALGKDVAPSVAIATQLAAPPDDPVAQKMAQATFLEQWGLKNNNKSAYVMAQKLRDEAMKARDENQGFETVIGPDGKPTIVQRRKYGPPQVMPYGPKPDIMSVAAGDRTEFIDKLRPPTSPIQHGQSAESIASNKVAWANYQLAKNADARAAEAAKAGGGLKPTWDSTSGMFVYPPTAESPTGRAIHPSGYEKADKPLTESQAKATAYANQQADASAKLAALEAEGFSGKSAGQQAAIVNAGTEGIPYIPGTAAIPRMIAGAKAQKYQQAELQWTEAALRFMTGANAPKEEVIRNAATYFPRPGDTDDVIDQKATARANMEESIRLAAGVGNKRIPPMPTPKGGSGGWSITPIPGGK